MTIKELREKSDVELDRLLVSLRNKLRELRFKVTAKQLGGIRQIREAKKDIARILTLKTGRPAAKPEAEKPAAK